MSADRRLSGRAGAKGLEGGWKGILRWWPPERRQQHPGQAVSLGWEGPSVGVVDTARQRDRCSRVSEYWNSLGIESMHSMAKRRRY